LVGIHPSPVKEADVTEHRTGTDVIDELTSDHREALELLHRIPSVTDPDQRRDLADTVISEIVRHSVAEEMYVYPAMRQHVPNCEQDVEHDTEEHQQLEEIMKQLEGAPASEPRFDSDCDELRAAVGLEQRESAVSRKGS
jgi:hemerythrin superfamily protein